MISSFDVDKFNCQNLLNPVYKLAVILYPADTFNEKFLINVRDCMLHLGKSHPVKRWLTSIKLSKKPSPDEQAKIDFLNEILSSPFNLITDQGLKKSVIGVINEAPKTTPFEKLLLSYLYLMIGNVTKSDNILKEMIHESPRILYSGFNAKISYFHRLSSNHIDKILSKMRNHPADRITYFLFTQYGKTYFNKQDLIKLIDENSLKKFEEKLALSYTEAIAPELVGAVRLSEISSQKRSQYEQQMNYSIMVKREWFWPFLNYPASYNEQMLRDIYDAEKSDPLWALYLINDEAKADLYLKKGGRSLQQRRHFLRSNLSSRKDFMLTLFKMIEMGDIDESLVEQVSHFLTNE